MPSHTRGLSALSHKNPFLGRRKQTKKWKDIILVENSQNHNSNNFITQTFLPTYFLKPRDSFDSISVTFFHVYFHYFHSDITRGNWFLKYFLDRIIDVATTHLTNVLQQHPYGQLSNCAHHPIQTQSNPAHTKLFCYLINKNHIPYLH